jgi:tRNA threonylcarbamoyladenosine biosynthesis protein TsaB
MLLLALDTSTHQASIALCSEDELCGEYSWRIGNNHSVALLVHIQRLVAECGKSMRDIEAVAVARGPGSFNGLRVALATAKTLAFTLSIPLVGVGTLDIIATQQRQWHGPVCAVLEAGRSDLYAACYVFDAMHDNSSNVMYSMRRLSDYLLFTPQRLGAYLQEQVSEWLGVPGERQLPSFLFCGEMSEASREALYAQMQEKSLFAGSIQATRHASTLALLALQLLHDGKEDDPLLLEPLYLRRPSITTSTRKQPLLGGLTHRPADQSIKEREEGALRH